MINIGKYIEIAINWLTEHFARFFDVINDGVGGFIDAFQDGLTWIPFYVMILGLALLAWFKAGKGVGVFTALGLLLIYGMGFWVETMQTLALVLSSTIIALMIGVPLGIWTARSDRADKIIHPVLDLMQTMPAFVYLIPAVLFGSGTRRFRNGDFRHASGCTADRSGNPSSPGRYCGGYPLIWRYFLSVAL